MAASILEITGCILAMAVSARFGLQMMRATSLKWLCPIPWRLLTVTGAGAALVYFAFSAVFLAKALLA